MQKAKGQVLAVLGISGIRAISGNWAQIPQIMVRETQQITQSVQFIISHQVRPYFNVRFEFNLF